jgi:hypothetical protein
MSALGHRRTNAAQNAVSALPPKADMCGATANVRYGPITIGSAPTAEAKKAPAGASLAQ